MIKHVVMWKFKDTAGGSGKEENLRKAKSLLEALPPRISFIREFEVGLDMLHSETSFDLILNSAFETPQDLVAYQQHEEHMKVVPFLRSVQTAKVVVDYVA